MRVGLCTFQSDGKRSNTFATQGTFSEGHFSLNHSTAYSGKVATSTIVTSANGLPAFTVTSTQSQSTVQYGAAMGFTGSLSSKDGRVYVGEINHRAASYNVATKTLRFADGKGPPAGHAPKGLVHGLQELFSKAHSDSQGCKKASPGAATPPKVTPPAERTAAAEMVAFSRTQIATTYDGNPREIAGPSLPEPITDRRSRYGLPMPKRVSKLWLRGLRLLRDRSRLVR